MSVKKKVEQVLKQHPNTRDSDTKLAVMVWWENHKELFTVIDGKYLIDAKVIPQLERYETISRIRRKFQAEGMYIGSKKVRQERLEREEGVRTTINTDSFGEDYLPH